MSIHTIPDALDAPQRCYGSQSGAVGMAPDLLVSTPRPTPAPLVMENNSTILRWLIGCPLDTCTGRGLEPTLAAQFLTYGRAVMEFAPTGMLGCESSLPPLGVDGRLQFQFCQWLIRLLDNGATLLAARPFCDRPTDSEDVFTDIAQTHYYWGFYPRRNDPERILEQAKYLRTMLWSGEENTTAHDIQLVRRMVGLDTLRILLSYSTETGAASIMTNELVPLIKSALGHITKRALSIDNENADVADWMHYHINIVRKGIGKPLRRGELQ